jgi:hypothetical protein
VYPEDQPMSDEEMKLRLKKLNDARQTDTRVQYLGEWQSESDQSDSSSVSLPSTSRSTSAAIQKASKADTQTAQTGTTSGPSSNCTPTSGPTKPVPSTGTTGVPPGRERFWTEDTTSHPQ